MAKIDWYKENSKNTFLAWVLTTSIAEKMNEFDKAGFYDDPNHISDMEIKMQINGIEVDVIQTIRSIEEQIDCIIEEKAKELIKNIMNA